MWVMGVEFDVSCFGKVRGGVVGWLFEFAQPLLVIYISTYGPILPKVPKVGMYYVHNLASNAGREGRLAIGSRYSSFASPPPEVVLTANAT